MAIDAKSSGNADMKIGNISAVFWHMIFNVQI